MPQNVIDMVDINMSFNGVPVLKHVNFSLQKGEIMGLIGKNGAGKSTLLKIIQGIYTPDSGDIYIDGKKLSPKVKTAERNSLVSMIYQDFSLIPEMTVVQNIFLNAENTHWGLIEDRKQEDVVKRFFARYGIRIDPRARIKNLSTSDMQMVEIIKSVIREKKIILMDEPTAALEMEQVEKLFEIIRQLKSEGISILLISHHLKEILQICDRVTVLCDGENVLCDSISKVDMDTIVVAMFGKRVKATRRNTVPFDPAGKAPLLEARGIASHHRNVPLSFKLYPGEVLGVVGLKGSGKTELVNNIFGIDPIAAGELLIRGERVSIRSPHDALKHKIFLIPENRQTLGLIQDHSLYRNMQLPWMDRFCRVLLNDRAGRKIVNDIIQKLEIKATNENIAAKLLSGGNQQKVVIGKGLGIDPDILLMDDPTYGIDVNAKAEISNIVYDFKTRGGAVILISSEIEDILNDCDRVIIMKGFGIHSEISYQEMVHIDEETITKEMQ